MLYILAARIYVRLAENAAVPGSGYFPVSLGLMIFWFWPLLYPVRRQAKAGGQRGLCIRSTGIPTVFGIYAVLMTATLFL